MVVFDGYEFVLPFFSLPLAGTLWIHVVIIEMGFFLFLVELLWFKLNLMFMLMSNKVWYGCFLPMFLAAVNCCCQKFIILFLEMVSSFCVSLLTPALNGFGFGIGLVDFHSGFLFSWWLMLLSIHVCCGANVDHWTDGFHLWWVCYRNKNCPIGSCYPLISA